MMINAASVIPLRKAMSIYFFECVLVKDMWTQVVELMTKYSNASCELIPINVTFNTVSKPSTCVNNFIWLLFKRHIYCRMLFS